MLVLLSINVGLLWSLRDCAESKEALKQQRTSYSPINSKIRLATRADAPGSPSFWCNSA